MRKVCSIKRIKRKGRSIKFLESFNNELIEFAIQKDSMYRRSLERECLLCNQIEELQKDLCQAEAERGKAAIESIGQILNSRGSGE